MGKRKNDTTIELNNLIGSLVKRSDRWQLRVFTLDENQKRMKEYTKMTTYSSTIKNKSSAKKMLREYMIELSDTIKRKDISKAVILVDKEIMFTDYIDKWLEGHKIDIAESTYRSYAIVNQRIKAYFTPFELKLSEVKASDIREYYNYLIDGDDDSDGVSKHTVQKHHANLKQIFKVAVDDDLITDNPMDKIKRPKKEKYEPDYYNSEEISKLFKAFSEDEYEICIYLAVNYGLRRSEILGLRWKDIDFKKNVISIKQSLLEILDEDGHYTLVLNKELKTKASRRDLKLTKEMKQLLIKEKAKQDNYKKICGSSYNTEWEGYVCRRPTGEIIRPNSLTDRFRTKLKTCELRKIRFHDLRHTCASILINNGAEAKDLQYWMGHSTITTTMNIYGHLFQTRKDTIGELMEKTMKDIILENRNDLKESEDDEN